VIRWDRHLENRILVTNIPVPYSKKENLNAAQVLECTVLDFTIPVLPMRYLAQNYRLFTI
jgi:hypothetical protein